MNYLKRYWLFVLGTLALALLVSGCKHPPKVTPPPPKPVTATLSADPSSIQRGQSTTLTWSTDGADSASLDGNNVSLKGSMQFSPTNTTTYHLHAKGAGGEQDASATVTVIVPTPTPTPTPRPTPPPLTDEQIFAQSVQDIYFDFDKADLRPEAQATLARTAEALRAHPNWKIQIEGNCDERGSTEYNLALGERRASSARLYLIANGGNKDALKSISYGKEKPVCTESNEDCWQKNRRDHFVLLSH